MRRGVLVVGFRTARASRWIRWLDSGVGGGLLAFVIARWVERAVVG